MMPMCEAPRDGRSIILYYRVRAYINGNWEWDGHKWEQCRWIDDKTSSEPHWEPWCGNWRTHSSLHITDEAAEGWMPNALDEADYFVTEFYRREKHKEASLVRVALTHYPPWVMDHWVDLRRTEGSS